MSWSKQEMAAYVSGLIPHYSSLNLGIGLPSLVANHIKNDSNIMIHSENGVLGVGESPKSNQVSPTLINAGKETISIVPGASFFDSSMSFGMIRGGHIDFCILGGMEVDINGNLANWMIPGKKITGMGGAMDLVNGAKEVIILMSHFSKSGAPKLVEQTKLPLTGAEVCTQVITDYGHFKPNKTTFEVVKLAPGISFEDCKIPTLV